MFALRTNTQYQNLNITVYININNIIVSSVYILYGTYSGVILNKCVH